MYKEDVVAYVLTKHLLCSLDIPDVRFLHLLLWFRTKVDVMGLQACMMAKQDDEVCVITNQHNVCCGSRLNGPQHYKDVRIS